jgi:hypothetical protein
MQEQFTFPRKKPKTFVPKTDDECESILCDAEEQSEDEELMTPTPRRAALAWPACSPRSQVGPRPAVPRGACGSVPVMRSR